MAYYRGDYNRGDYYRGSFGSFFGGLVKGVLHSPLVGMIPGVNVLQRGLQYLEKTGHVQFPGDEPVGATGKNPSNLPVPAGRVPDLHISELPPTMAGLPPAAQTQLRMGGTISPTGMAILSRQAGGRRAHPNKSTYVTRGGGTSRWPAALMVHPAGSELVPTRRMNVANARALRRALRRVAGFGKLAKRSRRAVSMAASALGVRHRASKRPRR